MSRRLRLETDRMKEIKEEEKVERDKLKLLKERIYAPIIWKELADEIKIIDLKENYYDSVLEMIKVIPNMTQKEIVKHLTFQTHFIPDNVLTRNAEMELDQVSTKSFLDQCLFQMKDTTSIVAVNYNDDPPALVGCCLMRVVHKEDFGRVFSGTIHRKGEAQEKCVKIRHTLQRRVNFFEIFNCDVYLKIHLVCIVRPYRQKKIGFKMMKCSYDVARSLQIPVIMGIFDNIKMQTCAKILGMKTYQEILYTKWRNEANNLIFDDPGPGNYSCDLMAGTVPQQPPAEPPPPPPPISQLLLEKEKEKGPQMTRVERREIRDKKKKKLAGNSALKRKSQSKPQSLDI